MSGIIARRVASTPERTALETWDRIVTLLAPDPESSARAELATAKGVACSSISSEATKGDSIVVRGAGLFVRVYCVFDDDAITGDNVNEDPLIKSPTEGEWSMSIPCLPEDLEWSQAKLSSASKRITARATGENVAADNLSAADSQPLAINLEEFLKP